MRRALLAAGLLTLAGLWLGPLPGLAQTSFSAHMTLHMGVVAVAAPLLALGLAGGPADPVRRSPGLFAPIPASLAELVAVWAWHAPVPHGAARCGPAALAGEQGTFLLAGLFVWLSAFGGDAARRADRTGAGIVAILLTSMHMTLLGALLALTPRPLYGETAVRVPATTEAGVADALCGPFDAVAVRPFDLSPLEDQHLGGAIMIVVGGVSYLIGGLWLTAGLIGEAPGRAGVKA